MRIRSKISLHLGLFIIVVISAIFILNYYFVRRSLTQNAHLELAKIEKNMQRAAQTLLSTAIKNYLRGITEKNVDFIEAQYRAVEKGLISKGQAKEQIQNFFNLQSVGKSGYLVAVEQRDSKLYLELHPFLARQECTDTEGCQEWVTTRDGYTEYNWKNPLDDSYRKKAAYVQEFPAWHWIVGASSYRDEFVNLINVEDLRELLGPIKINKSGYFFLFDENYQILIHPEFQNIDGRDLINSKGESILELLKASKDGYLTYLWKNPSENKERQKYAFIEKLEGYNWYLVASGYLSEVYQPIAYLKNLTIIMVLLVGGVLLLIIFRLSSQITTPLLQLKKGINSFYDRQSPFQWHEQEIEEINTLGTAFSRMTTELNRSISELQEKNAQLEISERDKESGRLFLDSIINSMPSIIIGVDPEMKVSQWNNRAEQVTGRLRAVAKGSLVFAVFPDLSQHAAELEQCLKENQTGVLAHSWVDVDGGIRYAEITIYPLITSGNQGGVIRIDEVTDRVEMEQRLRQSQKMDAIGQLAGGVAHDFNNMLSGIMGAADLLRLKIGPEHQNLIKIIIESSGRAGELIQKLLAFSRKEKIAFLPVNVISILKDTIEILERTLDKRIVIESRFDEDSVIISGDWSQLQNTFLNIGINGGHAMPEGGLLRFESETMMLDEKFCEESSFDISPGHYLQIIIRDSGIGIPREHLKHIFEPFFTTKNQTKGTGLGLAAVYGAVQQHHGAIFVSSNIGKGTEFKIVLPVSGEEAITTEKTEDCIAGEGCVLIIDDETVVRSTARLMLENIGYEVLEAENGQKGVEIYRDNVTKIDLVLLDMLMPVMGGTQCFYQLKEINPDARVIISSGFTSDADIAALRNAGLCDVVRKPYNLHEVSRAIGNSINNY